MNGLIWGTGFESVHYADWKNTRDTINDINWIAEQDFHVVRSLANVS